MNTIAALLLATPIFGLSLTPPETITFPSQSGLAPQAVTFQANPSLFNLALEDEAEVSASSEEGEISLEELAEQGQRRARLTGIHRAFGIATWFSMAATLTLGALQFADEYGFNEYDDTRCARGEAILGDWNCDTPFLHLGSVILLTSMYTTTFALSFAMNDPNVSTEGESTYARRVRMHKTLRWVHFSGMMAQIVEGVIFANLGNMGVDERDNHNVLQALNIVHLAIGTLTFAVLSWAAGLLIF